MNWRVSSPALKRIIQLHKCLGFSSDPEVREIFPVAAESRSRCCTSQHHPSSRMLFPGVLSSSLTAYQAPRAEHLSILKWELIGETASLHGVIRRWHFQTRVKDLLKFDVCFRSLSKVNHPPFQPGFVLTPRLASPNPLNFESFMNSRLQGVRNSRTSLPRSTIWMETLKIPAWNCSGPPMGADLLLAGGVESN